MKDRRKRDEMEILSSLRRETGLGEAEAELYLKLLRAGHLRAGDAARVPNLLEKGMAILSGDGKRVVPVHPRLGIANQYRVWREAMVREIGDRRMRVDRLILELIPVYESATDKRADGKGT